MNEWTTRTQTLALSLNCNAEHVLFRSRPAQSKHAAKVAYSQGIFRLFGSDVSVSEDFERIQNLKDLAETFNCLSFAPLTVRSAGEQQGKTCSVMPDTAEW